MVNLINNLPFSGIVWAFIYLSAFTIFMSVFLLVGRSFYRGFWTPLMTKRKEKASAKSIRQPEHIPSLNDVQIAQYIWEDINRSQFRRILTSLQTALKQSGYQLTFSGNGVKMHPHREEVVADNLMRARELFCAPNQLPDEIESLVTTTRKSGYSKRMLREMLAGCARQNWHLTAIKSDQELLAYPLRQVEIRVRGGMGTPVTDLLPCLAFLAQFVGDRPLKSHAQHIHRRGQYPSPQGNYPDLEYEMRLREINDPPGFFLEAAGSSLPPCAMQEKDSLKTSLNTQVTVFVQGTSTPGTGTGARTAFYQDALRQISDGKAEGAAFDDDSGYAFFVNRTNVHLSI